MKFMLGKEQINLMFDFYMLYSVFRKTKEHIYGNVLGGVQANPPLTPVAVSMHMMICFISKYIRERNRNRQTDKQTKQTKKKIRRIIITLVKFEILCRFTVM